MIEIPTWLLFVLVFSIIVLFVFYQDLNVKANRLKFDQIQIGIILNKSFEDITNDVDNLNKGIDQMDQKYEKIMSKINSR
jgi:peptidoglycan hydrolase CwlO-like protein|tara:strand:+ start:408 stop:647 length:240 start_codon:yes stop_codon:yes gene_type:complete